MSGERAARSAPRKGRLNAWLMVLAVLAAAMLLFAGWHVASTLGLRNGWGDTGRYIRASQVFSMPTEREALYPIVLRTVRTLLPRSMRFTGVQVLQLGAAFTAACYFAWSLWIADGRLRSSDSAPPRAAIPRRGLAVALGLVALLAVAEPVANHLHMTILTDSLAGSLMMTALAAMIAFAFDPARRRVHAGVALAAFLLVGILRPEKAFMNAAMFGTILAVGYAVTRWRSAKPQAARTSPIPHPTSHMPWRAWMVIAGLVLAVAIPVALAGKLLTPRNKGKYPSMYDPRMLVLTRVHLQSFGDIYKKLDRRTRIMFSNHDAGRIDRHRANLNILIATRLRDYPQFRGPIVEDIIATTWNEIRGKVLRQFAFDAGSYLLPPAGFYLELALPRKDAKLADFSRHQRMVMTNHQKARGIFPAWAVDSYLIVGGLWWVAVLGSGAAALIVSPAARAVVRERAPILGLIGIYHFWAIFPFLFLHNQFIVRYASPSYGVLMVALPTVLVLAYERARRLESSVSCLESRPSVSERGTQDSGLGTQDSGPATQGAPA